MKIKLLLIITIGLLNFNVFSQDVISKKVKTVINALSIVEPDNYRYPSEYIKEDGKTIGRLYTQPTGNIYKYYIIKIIEWDKNTPIKAKVGYGLNKNIVNLEWKEDKLYRITAPTYSNYDYLIDYNTNGQVNLLTSATANSKGLFYYIQPFYDGDTITKIITKQGKKLSKALPRAVYNYNYNKNGVVIDVEKYKRGTKRIYKKYTHTFTIKADNEYEVNINGYYSHYKFNSNNKLIFQEAKSKNANSSSYYEYINDSLFSVTFKSYRNNQFLSRITNYFDKEISDKTLPIYKYKKGSYDFNEKNEMISEKHGKKYRKKINGQWSEWQYVRY